MSDEAVDPGTTHPSDVFAHLVEARETVQRFMMCYQFAVQEIETKVSILQREFQLVHRYNPIEHVTSRVKTPESILRKARRRECPPTMEAIRDTILDIAGVRVVCSFGHDVHRVQQLLCAQDDIELVALKDYIGSPKPSGYRSLHAIVRVPVFLSDETLSVPVEMQFRTIAQDFWASLEHKIFYKYDHTVPTHLAAQLREAADTAAALDAEMERLGDEIQGLGGIPDGPGPLVSEDEVRSFLSYLGDGGRGAARG